MSFEEAMDIYHATYARYEKAGMLDRMPPLAIALGWCLKEIMDSKEFKYLAGLSENDEE